MKHIIFDLTENGHFLEYHHHLYMMAVNDPNNQYIFVLPKEFLEKSKMLDWPSVLNIKFDFFEDIFQGETNGLVGMLKYSYFFCKTLKKYILKHEAYSVFTNNIMSAIPMAPFVLPSKTRLSGIIYHIYLYTQHKQSFFKKALNYAKYNIMTFSSVFHNVFILNDEGSANRLNKLYKSYKFKYIPDPFVPLNKSEISREELRFKLGIDGKKKVFFHFGGLSERKGTLVILDTIRVMTPSITDQCCFIFAGVVGKYIRNDFYAKLKQCNCQILVYDEFCTYEFISSLCQISDAILAPYKETDLSSGMFGYASQFGIPLIAPGDGLIGCIIRKFNLGLTMDPGVSTSSLKNAIERLIEQSSYNISDEYLKTNNIENFQKTILNNIEL